MKASRNHSRKPFPVHTKISFILTGIFLISAIVLVIFAVNVGLIPGLYIFVLAVILLLLAEGVVFANRWRVAGIAANVVCCFMIIVCILGSFYIEVLRGTVREVQTDDEETVYMGVYVMDEDPAEELADTKGYIYGVETLFNTDAIGTAIDYVSNELGEELDPEEYENMYTMLNDLRSGTIEAIIIGESYMELAAEITGEVVSDADSETVAEIQGYDWVSTEVREIARIEVVLPKETQVVESDETEESTEEAESTIQNGFVVYISGIDTYGSVSVRSRSDVNILAVVNTTTRQVLLVTTPRDYYVTYERTGGAYDKLTHAGLYGIDQSMNALEQLYGIEINYFLRMNFTGFVNIIDAMGGITVNSDYAFSAGGYSYTQGANDLDGAAALMFARERHSFASGDFQRGRNQMAVITAMINKLSSLNTITNFQNIMNAIANSFETDMSTDEINALIRMQLSGGGSWSVESLEVLGSVGSAETFSMPGVKLSVIFQDATAVANASAKIKEVLSAGGTSESESTTE